MRTSMTPDECIIKIVAKVRYILGDEVPEIRTALDPSHWRLLPRDNEMPNPDGHGAFSSMMFACDKGSSGVHTWTAQVDFTGDKLSRISIWTPDGNEILSNEEKATGGMSLPSPSNGSVHGFGVRICELAKEMGVPSKVLVEKAVELGIKAKSHASVITKGQADRLRSKLGGGRSHV